MKTRHGLLALLGALVAALALAVPARAAEPTYTITIQGDGLAADHTYEAYQVFSGDLSTEEGGQPVLSNVDWGTGVDVEKAVPEGGGKTLIQALAGTASFTGCTSAADVAERLSGQTETSTVVNDFLGVIGSYLSTSPQGTSTENKGQDGITTSYTISGLEAGYYLVKDKDGSAPADGAYTDFILRVVENVTVEPKADVPAIDKSVMDVNDTTGATGEPAYGDSADYDIGDAVPFKLEVSLPSNYASYDTYRLVITDSMSEGLTFDESSVEVSVDGRRLTKDTHYTLATTGLSADETFALTIGDLKSVKIDGLTIDADSTITVTYAATLGKGAVVGGAGNPNSAKLTYSNNPNGTDTGTTPEDTVTVFTYKVVVNKVDGDKKPLPGAQFRLEKKVGAKQGVEGAFDEGGTYYVWKDLGTPTATGDDDNVFTFAGIDDGTYRLTETTTPEGYNTIDPVIFTVTAEHGKSGTEWKVTTLSGTAPDGTITFTPDAAAGSLAADVVNVSGSQLPSTGGVGTTVLYALGACLAVGAIAGVILWRRAGARG